MTLFRVCNQYVSSELGLLITTLFCYFHVLIWLNYYVTKLRGKKTGISLQTLQVMLLLLLLSFLDIQL